MWDKMTSIWIQKEHIDEDMNLSDYDTIYYDCRDDFENLTKFASKWNKTHKIISVCSLEKYYLKEMPEEVFDLIAERIRNYSKNTKKCSGLCLDFIRRKEWKLLPCENVKNVLHYAYFCLNMDSNFTKKVYSTLILPPIFGQSWKVFKKFSQPMLMNYTTNNLKFLLWCIIAKLRGIKQICVQGWDTDKSLLYQINICKKLNLEPSVFRYIGRKEK